MLEVKGKAFIEWGHALDEEQFSWHELGEAAIVVGSHVTTSLTNSGISCDSGFLRVNRAVSPLRSPPPIRLCDHELVDEDRQLALSNFTALQFVFESYYDISATSSDKINVHNDVN